MRSLCCKKSFNRYKCLISLINLKAAVKGGMDHSEFDESAAVYG